MSHPRVRPSFAHPLPAGPEAFFASLAAALGSAQGLCRGQVFAAGAILRIRSEDRRVWSPALHVRVERAGGEAHALHGQFSPSSSVWTAFVAIYVALGFVTLAAASYGFAQLTLQETPWAFFGVPLAILLAGLTYGAAFIGQGLGAEDMYELRAFVERVADSFAEASADGLKTA